MPQVLPLLLLPLVVVVVAAAVVVAPASWETWPNWEGTNLSRGASRQRQRKALISQFGDQRGNRPRSRRCDAVNQSGSAKILRVSEQKTTAGAVERADCCFSRNVSMPKDTPGDIANRQTIDFCARVSVCVCAVYMNGEGT